ncbi:MULTISPECIES: DUF2306 domain-containing protein [Arthrobacter]|uniref:DUF2306 domain-containing protein n=1 Tax=Arthrobacter terricola TaxID=2547396 RepID=A0A4R5KAA0_9MICC|nr:MULTISPECIES: DUF2306 domain-containing protein [Arthrobacter]MBT8163022.1 DUF2306 domain-containing protein [Arthrobacter sp. GN70]TDF91772.1 DUF2306 domain-containing protein [Arthrobacter terricola]
MGNLSVLVVSHLVAALYVIAIGPVQILRPRRDRLHRTMGYLWVSAMYYVCLSSFWIVSEGHFTWLHALSAFTLVTVTLGLMAAIKGNIRAHRGNMIGSFFGTLIAFGFAVGVPGRSLPRLMASNPGTGIFVALLVIVSVGVVYLSLFRGSRSRAKAGPGAPRRRAEVGRIVPAGEAVRRVPVR